MTNEEAMLSTERAARMCPVCAEDSRVYATRVQPDGTIIRKRRCIACGTRFFTREVFDRILPNKKKGDCT